MKFRKLGRTDISVSEICLGTMTWGSQNTESEGHEQMDYAIGEGINFFDTAEAYPVPPKEETHSLTEQYIGNWFSSRKSRDKIVLASKIVGRGLSWIRDGHPFDAESLKLALEGSLKRLKTDYIDLYQLHWPNRGHYHFGQHWKFMPTNIDAAKAKDDILETVQMLDVFIKAGKIRSYGLSNESAWGTMQFINAAERNNLARPTTIQNEYSLTYRLFEPDLAEVSLHEEVGLLAYSPLTAGAISGKYLEGQIPEGSRRSIDHRHPHRSGPIVEEAIRDYIEVAKKHGLDICQMAIAFGLSRPFMASVIIGATKMDQLKTNIESASLTLNDDVLSDIEIVRRKYPIPY